MIGPRFTADLEKSPTARRQSGWPSFRPIIENKNASFFTTFHPIGYRDEEDPDNGISLLAIRGHGEGPANSQGSAHDLRQILRKYRPPRHQSGRPSLRALIADEGASISVSFSRSDVGPKMVPEMGNP